MPVIKRIAGHTGCGGIRKYLEKNGRALAKDLFNLSWDDTVELVDDQVAKDLVQWDEEMDRMRELSGTNSSWKGKNARTFVHYVISPDPEDGINLPVLRELTKSFLMEHFSDYQAAVVYHDDNEGNIPHAHIMINNVNLRTGKRYHVDNPRALNRSLQDMAEARGLHFLRDAIVYKNDVEYPVEKQTPHTLQDVYVRRSEKEIAAEGGYSWVTDTRSRVGVARTLARNEGEFMRILKALDVKVSENSERSWRRDWIYSLDEHPTWRITGEKLGLRYGQEAMRNRFERKAAYHPTPESSRLILAAARDAILINDLNELGRLSKTIETCASFNVRSMAELEGRIERARERGSENLQRLVEVREFARERNLLPLRAEARVQRAERTEGASEVPSYMRRATEQSAARNREQQRQSRGRGR